MYSVDYFFIFLYSLVIVIKVVALLQLQALIIVELLTDDLNADKYSTVLLSELFIEYLKI